MVKRLFDVVMSVIGLVVCAPLLLLAAAAIKCSSPGPVLFRQERIGRGGRPFSILKLRTMTPDAPRRGGPLTIGDDPRITPIGRLLRRTKIDELPQLLNVLRGEMSFVGPRPEARKYVEMFAAEYAEVLRVRPGVTDWASIRYRDESTILGRAADPEQEYVTRLLPEKLALARQYVRRQSLALDLKILFWTLSKLSTDRLPWFRAEAVKLFRRTAFRGRPR